MTYDAIEPDVKRRPKEAIRPAQIRAVGLTGYNDVVRSLGGSPERLLTEYGLAKADIADSKLMIDLRQVIALYEATATKLDCPDFGMLLGANHSIEKAGPLALVAMNSSTMEESVTRTNAYLSYLSPNIKNSLVPDSKPGRHALTCEVNVDRSPCRRQFIECLVLASMKTLILLSQSKLVIRHVQFRHAAKLPRKNYRRHFSCPVLFGQTTNAVVFDSCVLDTPIPDCNPLIRHVAEEYMKRDIEGLPRSFVEKVETLISCQLGSPNCGMEKIADQLALHQRTLQRRLREHGTSLRSLLDDVRKAHAADYLTRSDLHLKTVTKLLGYTNQTSLNQSCMRWFKCSPSQARKSLL